MQFDLSVMSAKHYKRAPTPAARRALRQKYFPVTNKTTELFLLPRAQ
ncbi:hypothetical protein NHH82_04280 [Oxalobacteraceae bacterium OTU3REALA1]|nr:hypothetical protein NHH82_04280 [Oxalobacteraceae bacterium OTU3REALA1]